MKLVTPLLILENRKKKSYLNFTLEEKNFLDTLFKVFGTIN
jgi:hypothetical protein